VNKLDELWVYILTILSRYAYLGEEKSCPVYTADIKEECRYEVKIGRGHTW